MEFTEDMLMSPFSQFVGEEAPEFKATAVMADNTFKNDSIYI